MGKIKGVGSVICGRIEQGTLKPGQEVKFMPTHTEANPCTGKVFTIEMHHRNQDQAIPGDNIGINMKALPKDNMPKKGDIMFFKNDASVIQAKKITAMVQTLTSWTSRYRIFPNLLHQNLSLCHENCR